MLDINTDKDGNKNKDSSGTGGTGGTGGGDDGPVSEDDKPGG